MVKKYLLIIGCVIGLFTSKTYSQATTVLSIDSASIIGTGTFGDSAVIAVQVRVMDGFIPDTISGDIFYYYLTDSMVTPQIIELDGDTELIADPFLDTIQIPINAGEMKTGPLNLIVVWPAMFHPAVHDTDSIVFNLIIGYLGVEPEHPMLNENIVYPSPTMQYLFVKPDEVELINNITFSNMQGQIIKKIPSEGVQNGWINIDELNAGLYTVTLHYKNGSTVNKKIIKE